MARTPNRTAPGRKPGTRDEELRFMMNDAEEPVADDGDFPIEMGQEIEDRAARAKRGKILGMGAGERAFVSVAIFLIVVIFGVALLVATGRIVLSQ
jgi:hypothetical protein